VAKAQAAVEDALKYIAKVNSEKPRNEYFARTLTQLAERHLEDAGQALKEIPLHDERFVTPMSHRLTSAGKTFASNPNAEARTLLSSFFADTCGLKMKEGDRRTALIGNEFQLWKVAIDDEYAAGDPGAPGSSAIRKSRTRQLRRDASRKTRP
jgi:hypothetical protein